MTFQSLLPQRANLRARLPGLSIRWSRVIALTRWLLLAGIILILIIGGLATIANFRTIQRDWIDIPTELDINAQSLVHQGGMLYAVTTNGEVFHADISSDDDEEHNNEINEINWESLSDDLAENNLLALGADAGS